MQEEILEWMQGWADHSPDHDQDRLFVLLLKAAQNTGRSVVASKFVRTADNFFGSTANAEDVLQTMQRASENGLICLEEDGTIALTEELGEKVAAALGMNPDISPRPARGKEEVEREIAEWAHQAMGKGTYERDRDLILALGIMSQFKESIQYQYFTRVLGVLWNISQASGSIARAIARAERNGLVEIEKPTGRKSPLDRLISLTESGYQFYVVLLETPDIDAIASEDVVAAYRLAEQYREAEKQSRLDVMNPLFLWPAVICVASFAAFVDQVPTGRLHLHLEGSRISLQGRNDEGIIVWLEARDVGTREMYELVRDELQARGYEVRDGKYAFPSDLQPIQGRFEIVRTFRDAKLGIDVVEYTSQSVIYHSRREWGRQFKTKWAAFCQKTGLPNSIQKTVLNRMDFFWPPYPELEEFLSSGQWQHVGGIGPSRAAQIRAAIEAEGIEIQEDNE